LDTDGQTITARSTKAGSQTESGDILFTIGQLMFFLRTVAQDADRSQLYLSLESLLYYFSSDGWTTFLAKQSVTKPWIIHKAIDGIGVAITPFLEIGRNQEIRRCIEEELELDTQPYLIAKESVLALQRHWHTSTNVIESGPWNQACITLEYFRNIIPHDTNLYRFLTGKRGAPQYPQPQLPPRGGPRNTRLPLQPLPGQGGKNVAFEDSGKAKGFVQSVPKDAMWKTTCSVVACKGDRCARLCRDYIYIGASCRKGRDCPYMHVGSFEALNDKEKEDMKQWVARTDTVEFVPGKGPTKST